MKQTTRKMLAEIKKELKKGKGSVSSETWAKYGKEFLAFLHTLPDIESALSSGGFILDCNKKLCRNGDSIVIHGDDGDRMGHIQWSPSTLTFLFVTEDDEYAWYLDELYSVGLKFEKTEKRQEARNETGKK